MDKAQTLALGPVTSLGAIMSRLDIADEVDWPADHLPESAWLEHIPFAFWLIKVLQPTALVELGTHSGASYFSFCQAVQRLSAGTRCYSLDTWKGDPHAGMYGEEIFNDV